MLCSCGMARQPFIVFPYINELHILICREARAGVADRNLSHTAFRVVYQSKKTFGMFHEKIVRSQVSSLTHLTAKTPSRRDAKEDLPAGSRARPVIKKRKLDTGDTHAQSSFASLRLGVLAVKCSRFEMLETDSIFLLGHPLRLGAMAVECLRPKCLILGAHFSNHGRMIIMPVSKNAPNRKREQVTRSRHLSSYS